MEIVLVRHGRPQTIDSRHITGRELGELTRRYDAVGIDRTLAPPEELWTLAQGCGCIVASDLPRSFESAKWLAPEGPAHIEPDLREACLPDALPIPVRLPPLAHAVIARGLWWLNWCRSKESVVATRERADTAAERLCALTVDTGTVMVVGHGMFNRVVAASLRQRGWRGPRVLPSSYWSAATFFKSPDHQIPRVSASMTAVELFPIDDDGLLFISGDIDDWNFVAPHGIDVVIDLDGGLDACIPSETNHCLYVYFPFEDDDQSLPNVTKLHAVAELAASMIREGHRVLTHCNMGFNRSGLVAGLILKSLGMPGDAAVTRIRERRPGALYNDRFAEYLSTSG